MGNDFNPGEENRRAPIPGERLRCGCHGRSAGRGGAGPGQSARIDQQPDRGGSATQPAGFAGTLQMRGSTMKTFTIAAAAAILTMTASTALATGNNNGPVCVGRDACTTVNETTHNHGGKGGNASASAKQGQAQGQIQGQQQGQEQGQFQTQANRQNNEQTVNIENPWFTAGVTGVISSMVNDRCGRVAFGVPFSAYTCNVLMEAEGIQAMLTPVRGEKVAAQTALLHAARMDRTIRETLRAAGMIE